MRGLPCAALGWELEGGGADLELPCSLPATGVFTLITNFVLILLHLPAFLRWALGFPNDADSNELQLSATDVSARTTMKGAAKCDKHCELQNSVNQ